METTTASQDRLLYLSKARETKLKSEYNLELLFIVTLSFDKGLREPSDESHSKLTICRQA